jgi:hypothetical protein
MWQSVFWSICLAADGLHLCGVPSVEEVQSRAIVPLWMMNGSVPSILRSLLFIGICDNQLSVVAGLPHLALLMYAFA